MSFIFGIIGLDGEPVSSEDLNALSHSSGWENFVAHKYLSGNVALGVCHHPEREIRGGIYSDRDLTVVADIRIYDQDSPGKKSDNKKPEEVLAQSYKKWGPDCVAHLNGDYAAMIFDHNKHEACLLRDHIGTRPLVYTFDGKKLIFSSHEFGLVKSGLIQTGLCEEKLIHNFFCFKGKYPLTMFQFIRKITPGNCLLFQKNKYREKCCWTPEKIKKNKNLSFADAASGLRQLLLTATLRRMENVPTGLHVSGGLDSGGIASIVANHTLNKETLTCYSWSPHHMEETLSGINEMEFIEAFSKEKGLTVQLFDLDKNDTVKNAVIPEFEVQHIEHPVMQKASRDGVRILFSGWGGDEFVSLSTRGTVNHLFFSFRWLTLFKCIRKNGARWFAGKIQTDILPFIVPFGLLHLCKNEYTEWSKLAWFKPAFILKHWHLFIFHSRRGIFGYGNRTKFMLNLLHLYHLPDRMDSWSIQAEKYGFEYRYPLLDKDLLEFWFSIPVKYTYQDLYPRLLFREAMKGIMPEKIRTHCHKGEKFRMAYSFKKRQEGKEYLRKAFKSLSKEDHLPFFNCKALKKAFEEHIVPGVSREKFREVNKLCYYLRYVALFKKYLAGPDSGNIQANPTKNTKIEKVRLL